MCTYTRQMSHIGRRDNPAFIKARVYLLVDQIGVKDLPMYPTT